MAILTVRLADFNLVKLGTLLIESVEGVYNLSLDISEGAQTEVSSGTPSVKDGIWTGIGRSIEIRELTDIGIGMFNDSFKGLTGYSDIDDVCDRECADGGPIVNGLIGDSVYRGGWFCNCGGLFGSLNLEACEETVPFMVEFAGRLTPTLPVSEVERDAADADAVS